MKWHWSWSRRWLYLEANLDNINRPFLRHGWGSDRLWFVALEWGNGNSDPVWLVECDVSLPAWWVKARDRWESWRAATPTED